MSLAAQARSASPRLDAGDPIRAIATAAVVMQHVAHPAFHHPARASEFEWMFATVVVGLTKWAVPLFVMLSGALLLEPRPDQSMRAFYRRRLTRIGIPLLFWSAFYLLLKAAAFRFDSRIETLPELALRGRPFYHMFFLFVIMGLYVFTPMLRRFAENSTHKEYWLAIWLALGVAATAWILGEGPDTGVTLFLPYLGYFLAGWWIRRGHVGPNEKRWSWALFLGATAFLIGASIWLDDPRGPATRYLHGYQSVPLILMSLPLFVIMMEPGRFGSANGVFARACAWLGPLTLGIYLIHPAVLKALAVAGFQSAFDRTEVAVPTTFAVAFVVSTAATAAMRRVRVLAPLVGG